MAPTPAGPILSPCQVISHSGGGVLNAAHGAPNACFYSLGGAFIIGVPGSPTGDARPGYMACMPPAAADVESYCVEGDVASQWRFYPFPATGAKEVGRGVPPQDYVCVGVSSQLWTFHLDTFAYSQGCTLPPDQLGIAFRPCDAFLYSGAFVEPDIYATYGKAASCGLFGTTVVGVLSGNPQPVVAVCAAPAASAAYDRVRYCDFNAGDPRGPSNWRIVPLSVATGPVDSATFDTAAGTACLTVGAQSFTFTVATSAVTAGCAGATAATATP